MGARKENLEDSGGRKPGIRRISATLLRPYKAALEEVIQEHPELLKQIAHAQLKAAAGAARGQKAMRALLPQRKQPMGGWMWQGSHGTSTRNVDSNATVIVRFPGLDE